MVRRFLCFIVIGIFMSSTSQSQSVKIVGLGASSCGKYISDIDKEYEINKQYLAWAQGFMNGALVRAPAGVDDGLDLLPESFPVRNQLEFLREWCANNLQSDFSDASFNLFKDIRSRQGRK